MKYIRGIDVSGHQGDIDWAKVAASGLVQFAYIKASERHSFKAKSYPPNRAGAKANGIPSGAYHFAQLGTDPVANAKNFSDAIGDYGTGDLYPCLDVEQMGTPKGMPRSEQQAWMLTFASEFQRLRPDCFPLVHYGTASTANGNPDILKAYPFMWAAWWPTPNNPEPPVHRNFPQKNYGTWTIWQYSDRGKIPGIEGGVDLDVMREEDLAKITIGGSSYVKGATAIKQAGAMPIVAIAMLAGVFLARRKG